MKYMKKVIFVALALMPLIPVIAWVIVNVGGEATQEFIPMGDITFTFAESGVIFSATPNSFADLLLTPIFGQEPLAGVFEASARFLQNLHDTIGLPLCFPVIYAFWMAAYEVIVALLYCVVQIVTFVPRRVSEVLR